MALQETPRKRKKYIAVGGQLDLYRKPDTLRPYRLYNAKANVQIKHRYYSSQRHAEWGVLKELKWLPVGTVIDVIDVRVGHLLCTYQHVMENGKHGIRYQDF